METIQGDLLHVESGIICQQVNCQRVAGAGLALQIRKRWPEWYDGFSHHDASLGDAHYFRANQDLTIASLYAQDSYGREGRYTNYEAFYTSLDVVRNFVLGIQVSGGDAQVYLPHGIGCGLAGGDWHIVSAMIEAVLPGAIIVRRE